MTSHNVGSCLICQIFLLSVVTAVTSADVSRARPVMVMMIVMVLVMVMVMMRVVMVMVRVADAGRCCYGGS